MLVTQEVYDQFTPAQREDYRIGYNFKYRAIWPTKLEENWIRSRNLSDELFRIGRTPVPGMGVNLPIGAP